MRDRAENWRELAPPESTAVRSIEICIPDLAPSEPNMSSPALSLAVYVASYIEKTFQGVIAPCISSNSMRALFSSFLSGSYRYDAVAQQQRLSYAYLSSIPTFRV